jgi:hypothetical protein
MVVVVVTIEIAMSPARVMARRALVVLGAGGGAAGSGRAGERWYGLGLFERRG